MAIARFTLFADMTHPTHKIIKEISAIGKSLFTQGKINIETLQRINGAQSATGAYAGPMNDGSTLIIYHFHLSSQADTVTLNIGIEKSTGEDSLDVIRKLSTFGHAMVASSKLNTSLAKKINTSSTGEFTLTGPDKNGATTIIIHFDALKT